MQTIRIVGDRRHGHNSNGRIAARHCIQVGNSEPGVILHRCFSQSAGSSRSRIKTDLSAASAGVPM
jgi:hypothetical protein